MEKIKSKKMLILYACSGLGVNMLNMIVGSYLCSALLTGGFDPSDIGRWTYSDTNMVIPVLWGILAAIAKVIDGLIDLPFSHFADNLKTRWGRRKPALLIGYIPMLIAYVLFLVPLQSGATVLNTVWFALLLCIFYGTYTLTMLTYYATFAEVSKNENDIQLLSNAKCVCDVVYFSLSFALVPLFVSMGWNIRIVALVFLPLALTMMIPMFLLKEKKFTPEEIKAPVPKEDRPTVIKSIGFTLKDKHYIKWLCVLFVMNMGLQLFLSGINEYFSSTGINMTLVMAPCFVPVPFTILIYNWLVKKKGFGFGYRYVLLVFCAGMSLMGLVHVIPAAFLTPYAIMCSLVVSFSIGAFFSVTYSVPSQRAAARRSENEAASSMYFAVQGLFEAVSASIASYGILVFLKESFGGAGVSFMTLIVAGLCLIAFVMSFFLPKSILGIGKVSSEKEAA